MIIAGDPRYRTVSRILRDAMIRLQKKKKYYRACSTIVSREHPCTFPRACVNNPRAGTMFDEPNF